MPGVLGVLQGRFGRVTLFETSQPVHEHAHPHVHALFKVAGQDGAYDVAGEACPIADDRIVLVNPWVPHANWRPVGGPTTTILALYLEVGWFEAAAGRLRTFAPFACRSAPATAELAGLVATIAAAITRAEDGVVEQVESDLFELSRRLLADHADTQLPASARLLDHRVRRAMALMRSHPSLAHDIDELAVRVGMSRSRFYEQFRAGMGMSPGVYSDTLRVEYAIGQMIRTERPVGEIALDLGFSAPGHFTRFFKEKLGFTPTEYRRVAHEVDDVRM